MIREKSRMYLKHWVWRTGWVLVANWTWGNTGADDKVDLALLAEMCLWYFHVELSLSSCVMWTYSCELREEVWTENVNLGHTRLSQWHGSRGDHLEKTAEAASGARCPRCFSAAGAAKLRYSCWCWSCAFSCPHLLFCFSFTFYLYPLVYLVL